MKSLRYIKHRSYSHGPAEMVQAVHHNPLKANISVRPSHSLRVKLLHDFKIPINYEGNIQEPFVFHLIPVTFILNPSSRMFCDKSLQGWLAWSDEQELYHVPHPTRSTFLPWEKASEAAIASVRDVVTDSSFWKQLSGHFAEETHEVVVTQDNISCVKSICESTSLGYSVPVDVDLTVTTQSNFLKMNP